MNNTEGTGTKKGLDIGIGRGKAGKEEVLIEAFGFKTQWPMHGGKGARRLAEFQLYTDTLWPNAKFIDEALIKLTEKLSRIISHETPAPMYTMLNPGISGTKFSDDMIAHDLSYNQPRKLPDPPARRAAKAKLQPWGAQWTVSRPYSMYVPSSTQHSSPTALILSCSERSHFRGFPHLHNWYYRPRPWLTSCTHSSFIRKTHCTYACTAPAP